MQGLEKILEEIEKLHGEAGSECTSEDHYVKRAWEQCIKCVEDIISKHMNDGWIPVDEQMPEEKINPITSDYYEYQVTARFGGDTDVRHYKFGNGHWWNGPGIVDKYVIAWRPLPDPYRPERSDNYDRTGSD